MKKDIANLTSNILNPFLVSLLATIIVVVVFHFFGLLEVARPI